MATNTQIDVVMPQMGVSVSEGTVSKWLKAEGEHVDADEALLEISTDKVDTEVPSPGEGVLARIVVQEGETVEVGTVLAVIAPEGAALEEQPSAAPQPEPQTLYLYLKHFPGSGFQGRVFFELFRILRVMRDLANAARATNERYVGLTP